MAPPGPPWIRQCLRISVLTKMAFLRAFTAATALEHLSQNDLIRVLYHSGSGCARHGREGALGFRLRFNVDKRVRGVAHVGLFVAAVLPSRGLNRQTSHQSRAVSILAPIIHTCAV